MKQAHVHLHLDDLAKSAGLHFQQFAADLAVLGEGQTTCCSARRGKHCTTDSQGIA